MVKAMQSEKSVIPCPCKKDCADRCDGCKLECKKFGIYEKLKRYENNKIVLNNAKQDYYIREYKGYRFLRSGTVKGITVDNLKLIDTGRVIRIGLSDGGTVEKYNLDMVIYKLFNGRNDFNDDKIKIIHKDGDYKNCSFNNLESVMA